MTEDRLTNERIRGCGYALITIMQLLESRSEEITYNRWATKKGQKAFKAILCALVDNIMLFMEEGENVQIFVSKDLKRAKIKSMKEER